MGIEISGGYTHYPYFVANLVEEICKGLGEKYDIKFAAPKIVRGGRALRNLFIGEKRAEQSVPGIHIRHSLRDKHDNYLHISISEKSSAYKQISETGVKTVDGLIDFLQTKTSNPEA